ncbi:MAG: UDP-glucose/GDP-mannose dehydrogenase family protein [Gammaproteobacteria bacterium]|nr:UDP-glucose/GDP-mannose dehydrogenase family protein [Gammaproteobacteria bacterium]
MRSDTNFKITILGSGYVGLVTGVCLAEIGNEVICADTDSAKINLLKQGKSPIHENNMEEFLTKNILAKRISFTEDAASGIKQSKFIFIAVGTPSAADGSADLQYIFSVAKLIGQNLENEHEYVIVMKSTVPVGTGDKAKEIINNELKQRSVSCKFAMVSNPEFLKQGDAIRDFMHSDRIIVGTDLPHPLALMHQLYAPLKAKIISMDIRSAELAKYAANAFLATKISFINEIAQFAEKFGADIDNVRIGIGTDPRIGLDFLHAGCGYGGSCFPKDVKALIWMAREYGMETSLFNAVEGINLRQKHLLFNRIKKRFGDLEGKVIAVWGLAFKPNTNDMREAPSMVLLESLWRSGVLVRAYDPVAMPDAQKIYGERVDFILCDSAEDALVGADALAIVTEWEEFRKANFANIKSKLKQSIIFDGRNIFHPLEMAEQGIEYYCVGRKKVTLKTT